MPEDVVGEDVPTNAVDAEPNISPMDLNEKAIERIVERVFKKINLQRRLASKSKKSKYDIYQKSSKNVKENKFLDNDKRDKFGRNKKYL